MQQRLPASGSPRPAIAHYEISAYARAGRAVRAQPQLLALRRLPRRRRRRARQAHRRLARRLTHRAHRARARAASLPGARPRAPHRRDAPCPRRAAVRVHDERAAPASRGSTSCEFERAHGPGGVGSAGTLEAAGGARVCWKPSATAAGAPTRARACGFSTTCWLEFLLPAHEPLVRIGDGADLQPMPGTSLCTATGGPCQQISRLRRIAGHNGT